MRYDPNGANDGFFTDTRSATFSTRPQATSAQTPATSAKRTSTLLSSGNLVAIELSNYEGKQELTFQAVGARHHGHSVTRGRNHLLANLTSSRFHGPFQFQQAGR